MSDYWIPISYNETTAENLKTAVETCHSVHLFTLKTLNDYFIHHTENLLLGDFRAQLAKFFRDNKKVSMAQHYSLTKAAEKTFPYFSENKKINKNGKFIAVRPIPLEKYHEIQIEKRQVWRKYLALNSLITTTYGTIYLDVEKWPEIIAEQAAEKGIPFDTVPFLWHSVVIHVDSEDSKLRFNLHEPDSKFGKRAKKGMRQFA